MNDDIAIERDDDTLNSLIKRYDLIKNDGNVFVPSCHQDKIHYIQLISEYIIVMDRLRYTKYNCYRRIFDKNSFLGVSEGFFDIAELKNPYMRYFIRWI